MKYSGVLPDLPSAILCSVCTSSEVSVVEVSVLYQHILLS